MLSPEVIQSCHPFHYKKHTCTHNHFTALWILGEPVPEETFTHSHLSWSSVIPNFVVQYRKHGYIPVKHHSSTV